MVRISENTLLRLRQLSCEDVAERLGMEVKNHKALCVIPSHQDHHPSLAFLGAERKNWFCFVCNQGGDSIKLVMEKTGWSFIDACVWLCNQFGISQEEALPKAKKTNPASKPRLCKAVDKKTFNKDIALFLIDSCGLTDNAKRFLFEERKLSLEVIKAQQIVSLDGSWDVIQKMKSAFSEDDLLNSGLISLINGKMYLRFMTPCLIIPYFGVDYKIIGLQSRYLGHNSDAPRFQFVSSVKTHLYNLPIVNKLKPGDELYISEGITDCLALLSSGKNAVAIPSATILPKLDLLQLRKFKLRMYPDQDDAGEQAFVGLQRFFVNQLCFLKAVRLPKGIKDFSDYYKQQYGV